MSGRHFALVVVPAAVLAAVAVLAVLVAAGGRHKPPVCKSAISSIRIVGDRTVRGPVVWFPKGCRHG